MPKFTAMRTDHTYTDAEGVVIHYYGWQPAEPKAIVQLLHGLGDHALRYEEVAQELVGAGFGVFADDHRGHGATGMQQHGGDVSQLGHLGPGGLRAVGAGVHQLTEMLRAEHPGIPLALVGHSWGSLIAQDLINDHASDYDAAVLTGTAYRTLQDMNGGDLTARHRHLGPTGYDWLSRDPAVAQAFADDPLTFDAKAMQLFGIRDSLRLLGRPKAKLQRDLPLLIMIGSDDTFGGEESIEKLADAYVRRSHLTDVTAVVYPDARHEVFNETNRAEVFVDLIAWLDSRLFPAHDESAHEEPA